MSNLKYLNQAYEDESTVDARSRGASNHFIRRQNRQSVSNGTTITTGYIMASNDTSRANSRSELVSITDSMSEDYRMHQQRSAADERHAHFSPRTETINGSATTTMNGSIANSNGTLPNGISTISHPPTPPPARPPTPPPLQNGLKPKSTRREFIPMT